MSNDMYQALLHLMCVKWFHLPHNDNNYYVYTHTEYIILYIIMLTVNIIIIVIVSVHDITHLFVSLYSMYSTHAIMTNNIRLACRL